jgi:hypothetical protein
MTPGGIVPVRTLEHRQDPVRRLPVGFTHQTHPPVLFAVCDSAYIINNNLFHVNNYFIFIQIKHFLLAQGTIIIYNDSAYSPKKARSAEKV